VTMLRLHLIPLHLTTPPFCAPWYPISAHTPFSAVCIQPFAPLDGHVFTPHTAYPHTPLLLWINRHCIRHCLPLHAAFWHPLVLVAWWRFHALTHASWCHRALPVPPLPLSPPRHSCRRSCQPTTDVGLFLRVRQPCHTTTAHTVLAITAACLLHTARAAATHRYHLPGGHAALCHICSIPPLYALSRHFRSRTRITPGRCGFERGQNDVCAGRRSLSMTSASIFFCQVRTTHVPGITPSATQPCLVAGGSGSTVLSVAAHRSNSILFVHGPSWDAHWRTNRCPTAVPTTPPPRYACPTTAAALLLTVPPP